MLDDQGGWTTVERRRGGKSQAGSQSEKLTRSDRAREWPGSTQQQSVTEAPLVEPLSVAQKTASPSPIPVRRHPSRRQRRKRLRQDQRETEGVQRSPTKETEETPVDVPAAPATETLPPRRLEQVNLCTDSVGCSPKGVTPAGPAGRTTAGPPGNQRVTSQAVTYIGSLFVPGKVAGRNLSFLVDTGCTHNLLSTDGVWGDRGSHGRWQWSTHLWQH